MTEAVEQAIYLVDEPDSFVYVQRDVLESSSLLFFQRKEGGAGVNVVSHPVKGIEHHYFRVPLAQLVDHLRTGKVGRVNLFSNESQRWISLRVEPTHGREKG